MIKKAIIILSGGLDSAVLCAIAKSMEFELYALSFFYGQRHEVELDSAKKLTKFFEVKEHKIIEIDLRVFGNSALTADIEVPKNRTELDFNPQNSSNHDLSATIPITYVPARNTIFLSYALAYAEVINAFDIFIGINAIDFSGYPDCRPEYISCFENLANLATVAGVKSAPKNGFKIQTPLLHLGKKEIIETGVRLGVDFSYTHSCYDPVFIDQKTISCGQCDSCKLRLEGFFRANLKDPLPYLNL